MASTKIPTFLGRCARAGGWALGAAFLACLACSTSRPDSRGVACCVADAAATSAKDANVGDAGAFDAATVADGSRESVACVVCGRDWETLPAVVELDGAEEIWALSDVHADYEACTKLLTAGRIIAGAPSAPGSVEWTAGHATFVVVGDLVDKGPDAPDVVRLFIALGAAATAAGGRVVVTMGNHEAEFLADADNSKASSTDGLDPELLAAGLSPSATAAGEDDIGAFLRGLPFAARVDDWFFVHAGNTGGLSASELRAALQSGVDTMGFGAPVLAGADSLLEARLSGSSPQWWDATGDATALLSTWTAALGAKHLVMGHQPGAVGIQGGDQRAKDQMASEFGGLLFLIDTGLSVDVDDTGGALLHVTKVGVGGEAWEEVLPDGTVKSL